MTRAGMAKNLIKKLFPAYQRVRHHPSLRFFGTLLQDPNLWHMNRRSVANAFAVGLFCAFLPVPMQMVVAATLAIILRVNLPISVLLVWVSNPLTMPFIFFIAYQIGRRVLDEPARGFALTLDAQWFSEELLFIWKPLLVGSLIMSAVAAILGYLFIRIIWRLHIIRRLKEKRRRLLTLRKQQKALKKSHSEPPDPRKH